MVDNPRFVRFQTFITDENIEDLYLKTDDGARISGVTFREL